MSWSKKMTDRFKFRAGITGKYKKDDGGEAEIQITIKNLVTIDAGGEGIFVPDDAMVEAVGQTDLSDQEQENLCNWLADNFLYAEDGYYFDHVDFLEQCTGLKDKNGKLIYEGDWLKTKDGSYCYVVWFDGFWWVKSLPSEAMDCEHAEFYKKCEVVGNIHENADLIQVKGVKTR